MPSPVDKKIQFLPEGRGAQRLGKDTSRENQSTINIMVPKRVGPPGVGEDTDGVIIRFISKKKSEMFVVLTGRANL